MVITLTSEQYNTLKKLFHIVDIAKGNGINEGEMKVGENEVKWDNVGVVITI